MGASEEAPGCPMWRVQDAEAGCCTWTEQVSGAMLFREQFTPSICFAFLPFAP